MLTWVLKVELTEFSCGFRLRYEERIQGWLQCFRLLSRGDGTVIYKEARCFCKGERAGWIESLVVQALNSDVGEV